MSLPMYLVDAFAELPFEGNQAAVCLLKRSAPDDWMQRVGMEMKQAETAFLWPEGEFWRLRWFTPEMEIKLCGHATLASAHVLWQEGLLPLDTAARFMTLSGELVCNRLGVKVEMSFPSVPPTPCDAPTALLEAMGAELTYVGHNGTNFLVEVTDETTLRGLQPDSNKIMSLDCLGVIATCRSSGEFDFMSRYFAPIAGLPEDSATGSSHCCLSPYWSPKIGKDELLGFQASKRGAKIGTRLEGDRVVLSGSAVTTVAGTLLTGY